MKTIVTYLVAWTARQKPARQPYRQTVQAALIHVKSVPSAEDLHYCSRVALSTNLFLGNIDIKHRRCAIHKDIVP